MRDPFDTPWLAVTPLLATATTAQAALPLDDRIRNAASLISLALALLTLFTNRRLAKFDEEKATLGEWKREVVGPVALDVLLFFATLLVLLTIRPLVADAWPPHIGRGSAVIPNLLLIATAGLIVVAGIQLSVAVRRIAAHTTAWRTLRN